MTTVRTKITAPQPAEPRARRALKVGARVGVFFGVLYAAWCAAFYVIQTRVVFPREYANQGDGSTPEGFEEVEITARDGTRIDGLFRRTLMASKERPMPAVMLFHGNAELIGNMAGLGFDYSDLGFNVLIAEYRGYGRTAGEPSQAAIVSDMCEAYDWLAAREDVDGERIVLHGRSIGGSVAAQVAVQRGAAGLVLESTPASVACFARRYLIPSFLVKHPFRTDEVLPKFGRPVLLLHGSGDTIVPCGHSRELHELAPGSTLVELEGGHNDFPRDQDAYWATIDGFLRKNGLTPGARRP